jgi:hypothetical protein
MKSYLNFFLIFIISFYTETSQPSVDGIEAFIAMAGLLPNLCLLSKCKYELRNLPKNSVVINGNEYEKIEKNSRYFLVNEDIKYLESLIYYTGSSIIPPLMSTLIGHIMTVVDYSKTKIFPDGYPAIAILGLNYLLGLHAHNTIKSLGIDKIRRMKEVLTENGKKNTIHSSPFFIQYVLATVFFDEIENKQELKKLYDKVTFINKFIKDNPVIPKTRKDVLYNKLISILDTKDKLLFDEKNQLIKSQYKYFQKK